MRVSRTIGLEAFGIRCIGYTSSAMVSHGNKTMVALSHACIGSGSLRAAGPKRRFTMNTAYRLNVSVRIGNILDSFMQIWHV